MLQSELEIDRRREEVAVTPSKNPKQLRHSVVPLSVGSTRECVTASPERVSTSETYSAPNACAITCDAE